MGKLSQVSMPHAPNAGPAWTTYTYDALGRTSFIVKPDNSVTHYFHSGNTTSVMDAANNWKTFTTDALGNLVTVAEPDPNLGTVSTNYTYNLLNKLTQVQMPRGLTTQTRTFTYDQSGQGAKLMSATNPENGTVSYTYNGDGTLATKHDAKGQTVTYSYDGYQRMTQVNRSDGSVDNYYYDSYSGSQNAMGRLAAATFGGQPDPGSGAGTQFGYVYSYTPAGQVTAKTLTLARSNNSASLTANYAYDGEGHMTSLTYPSTQQAVNVNGHPQLQTVPGPVFAYGYDSMGRANTLSQTGGDTNIYCWMCGPSLPVGIVSGVDYGPASELLQIHGAIMTVGTPYPGETRMYNSLLQVTSIVTAGTSVQYGYPGGNNIGKINQKTDAITGEQVQYTYDSLGRLLTAQGSASSQGAAWNYTYSYDGFGNLTAKTGNGTAGWSAGADPTTNRAGGGSYDANGNYLGGLAQGPYTYDVENRLTAWQGASPGEQYGYDNSNKRIQKQRADGVEEIHFYGAGGERLGIYALSAVYNGSQFMAYIFAPQTQNLYFAGKLVGRINVGMNWVGQDRVGSDGGFHSYPWGEEKQTTSSNVEKFATYYRDQSTGLDYADQRYYASIMGRFLTPDPYRAAAGSVNNPSNPQSWNHYAYVTNDPINMVDPRGLDGCGGGDVHDPTDCIMDTGGASNTVGYNDPLGCFAVSFLGNPLCFLGFTPAALGGPAGGPSSSSKRTPKFLQVADDCYRVPSNGGPVTREITYKLYDDSTPPLFDSHAVVWEHLKGDLPNSGADSPSSSAPGWFPDQQSIVLGNSIQHVSQTFTAKMDDGSGDIPVFVRGFNGVDYGTLDIWKTNDVIYINGNAGGKVDPKTGKLVPGSYEKCK